MLSLTRAAFTRILGSIKKYLKEDYGGKRRLEEDSVDEVISSSIIEDTTNDIDDYKVSSFQPAFNASSPKSAKFPKMHFISEDVADDLPDNQDLQTKNR